MKPMYIAASQLAAVMAPSRNCISEIVHGASLLPELAVRVTMRMTKTAPSKEIEPRYACSRLLLNQKQGRFKT